MPWDQSIFLVLTPNIDGLQEKIGNAGAAHLELGKLLLPSGALRETATGRVEQNLQLRWSVLYGYPRHHQMSTDVAPIRNSALLWRGWAAQEPPRRGASYS